MKQSISNGSNFVHQEGTLTSHAIASLVSVQIWLQQSLAWNISTNVQLLWNTSAERLNCSESSDKILPWSWRPHPLKVQQLASAGIAPCCSVYNAIKWSILTTRGNPSLLAVKNKSVLRYYEHVTEQPESLRYWRINTFQSSSSRANVNKSAGHQLLVLKLRPLNLWSPLTN